MNENWKHMLMTLFTADINKIYGPIHCYEHNEISVHTYISLNVYKLQNMYVNWDKNARL